jgi:alcohol dehydrogenase
MRELVFIAPGRLEWRERCRPVIQHPEDAIVRPVSTTICDLDRLIIRGEAPFEGPFAIGHECIAEVTEAGSGTVGLYPGQLVVVSWHISCGRCHRCRRHLPNTCANFPPGAMYGLPVGGDWGGTFSDLLRVPHASAALAALPPNLDPTHLASLSDNLPFGFEFTVPHLEQAPGADVLVMGGCGSIALYAAAFAKAGGAGRVDYVDTDRSRLEIAQKLGANPIESGPRRRFGDYPITVDASANAEGLICAVRSTEREGVCSSVGGHFAPVPMPLLEMYSRGIRFHTGRGKARPNFEETISFISAGRVRPELITSEVASFDDAPQVLAVPSLKPMLVRQPVHAQMLAERL